MINHSAGHAPHRPAAAAGQGPDEPITVAVISAAEHASFARAGSHSFLQTPAWAAVKPDWSGQSLGWFLDGQLTGTALVLYRRIPGTRRSLAYLPEGPCLPWQQVCTAPAAWLDPFLAQLRADGAFAVRIGPQQVLREWLPATVKGGLATGHVRRFAELTPDVDHLAGSRLTSTLRGAGWTPLAGHTADGGFGAGQPDVTVRIPLRDRTPEHLLAAASQQWRRNLARAKRAGVVVREGSRDDLGTFHQLYAETAARDGFTPRPASYFTGMWDALLPDAAGVPGPVLRLYLAELDGAEPDGAELGGADPDDADPDGGQPLAAALMIRSGDVCWYVYGASTAQHRSAQASTALQWQAICDAQAQGCTDYDLRGIGHTLDPDDRISGLVRFKLNTGGVCTQTAGEWELVLSRPWHTAFTAYQRIRS